MCARARACAHVSAHLSPTSPEHPQAPDLHSCVLHVDVDTRLCESVQLAGHAAVQMETLPPPSVLLYRTDARGAFGFKWKPAEGDEKRCNVIMLFNSWGVGSFRLVPTRQARPSALGVRVEEPTCRAQNAQRTRIVETVLTPYKVKAACTSRLQILFCLWKLILSPSTT